MVFKVLFLLFSLISTIFAQEATISCNYNYRGANYPYTCILNINNPNGFDDFENIMGQHVEGFDNENVTSIDAFAQTSTIIPQILCSQFPNLEQITFMFSEVEVINERSFALCGGSLRTLNVIHNNIAQVSTRTFRNNSNLRYVYLSNNFITEIDAEAFTGSAISYLDLEFNLFSTFDPLPLERINTTLTTLGVFANYITTLPSNGFANIRNLEWLDMTANEFQSLPDDAFVGLDRLRMLYLIACNLRQPNALWFEALPELVELHLELNEITDLSNGVFNGLRRLTNLYLGYNELSELTTAPFGGSLMNIEVLSVLNNQVSAIHNFFFHVAENLNALELGGNSCSSQNFINIQNERSATQSALRRCFDNFGPEFINCNYQASGGNYSCVLTLRNPNGNNFETIEGEHLADRENEDVVSVTAFETNTLTVPSILCSEFSQLQNIVIIASYIEQLRVDAFNNCLMVEQIDLSYNGIRTIEDQTFSQNSNLRLLNLRRNVINRIGDQAFTGSAIENLDLSYNEIFDFHSASFEPINMTLRSLDLNSNRIAILYQDTFANLRNLNEIILNGNYLYIVPNSAFQSLSNVQTLGLSNCGLQELQIEWFSNLRNLQNLYIASNSLKEFPATIFDSLENLLQIFFYDNQIVELNSNSFGASLENLTLLYGTSNEINSIDNKILTRGISLQNLLFTNNLCTQNNFYNVANNIEIVREALSRCIENFEIEPRLECHYELNEFDGTYSCALTAINPVGREIETINGQHITGNNDDDVTFVFADFTNTLTIPSALCSQFSNLNHLEFLGSFVNTLSYSSFINCRSLTSFTAVANNISIVPPLVFDGARNLSILILSSNRIHRLSANAFYGTQISQLDLAHNQLEEFDVTAFSVIGNTLRSLRLTDNMIQHLPIGAFESTPNLIELDLSHNHLYTVPSDIFSPLIDSLNALQLLDCGLSRIDEQWFRGLDQLHYLQLSWNEIDHLPENIFDLPKLENLGLAHNNLQILDSKSFGRSLSVLFHIDASENKINAFDPHLFENATSLFGIELMNNLCIDSAFLEIPYYRENIRGYFLECFEIYEDASLSCKFSEDEANYRCDLTIRNEMERLRFQRVEGEHLEGRNDNYVTNIYAEGGISRLIPSILCQQFRFIESIVFVNSQIEFISLETFRNCEFLFSLNLGANRISSISDGVFINNPYLSSLTLALNRIESISSRAFEGTQIYYLDLEDNHLATFDPISFAPIFNNLFYLILRHNLYSTFPRNAFTGMRNLRMINLNGNRLDFLPSNAFRSLTSLHTLELADCNLNNLNYRWFDDLQNLETLEFDMNAITQLPNLVFDLPNLSYLGIAANRLSELNLNAFGRSIVSLRTIRAENNQIIAIDERIIDNAIQLFSFTLSGNVCVNFDFIEVQENIETVREYLNGCFENFRNGTEILIN
ncbi:hypothetical protein PVAND_014417 [Polypedilum vanderplanki]|uniref:Uncharacterized protein n=1 Tax=Polypedilum vanderplanki TaxID=319348 RepID=A0A9J6B9C7_POLVA|nr:hypothetical protein PVAND_014417 [Polypedilum vanderplanki]